MLLAVDIGNSAIKFGIFDSASLLEKYSIDTSSVVSGASVLTPLLEQIRELFPALESVLVCSVVPAVDEILRTSLQRSMDRAPIFVDHNFDFGLKVAYEPVSALGLDRIVNASAAARKYGAAVIVCSFGTATTIDVVDETNTYLGGTISPGLGMLAAALHEHTAKLPHVDIEPPASVIGTNTTDSIKSGIFYGHLAGAEGIIARINERIGARPTVVATGGFAELIAEGTKAIDHLEENLTLEGLQMLYERMNA